VTWQDGPKRDARELPGRSSNLNYSPDLAETLTGRIRADLFRCMRAAEDKLLVAHTDGIWTSGSTPLPSEWRAKETVYQLDVLTPQVLRYYRKAGGPPSYVLAGVPDKLCARWWAVAWNSYARQNRRDLVEVVA